MIVFTHPRILLLLLLLLLLIEFYFSLIFLDSYDQTPPLHSLTRTLMTVFTHPQILLLLLIEFYFSLI